MNYEQNEDSDKEKSGEKVEQKMSMGLEMQEDEEVMVVNNKKEKAEAVRSAAPPKKESKPAEEDIFKL